jgi:hypothetical protein
MNSNNIWIVQVEMASTWIPYTSITISPLLPSFLVVWAYIFGTKGLISLQYDHVNFQNTSFDIGNGDDNFINQNKKIESTLQAAGTLKVGGEYRMNQLSLRGDTLNKILSINYPMI